MFATMSTKSATTMRQRDVRKSPCIGHEIMRGGALLCSTLALQLLWIAPAKSAGTDSIYLSLSKDSPVLHADQELLTAKIQGGQTVFVSSDGVFLPKESGLANAYIAIDGRKVSNDCWIDWRSSQHQLAHSFRAIGVLKLDEGPHTIALVANGLAPFAVSAGSNLVIMTKPAERFVSDTLSEDSSIVDMEPPPRRKESPLPFMSVAGLNIQTDGGPMVALSAGRSYHAVSGNEGSGDAWWGFWIDGNEASANNASYADNDLCIGAEMQAPMFNQGLFDKLPQGPHQIRLGATAEPWPAEVGSNKVRYRVGKGTRLIALTDGIRVAGHVAAIDSVKELNADGRFAFRCIASSQNWKTCPTTGQDVTVASGTIDIPGNHNGVVFISGMTRIQGDLKDSGGTTEIWLTIDGVKQGSTAEQQLMSPDSESTRTASLSFLTAGSNSLSVGKHNVELHARAKGDFVHLMVTRDTPLMWFD